MESPPLARYIPQKSKKRVFSGTSSSYMEPDVVEIVPPISRISNSLKQKGVIHQEIIDIDMDEDSADVMVIDEKVDTNKGKEVLSNYLFGPTSAANLGSVDGAQSFKSFAPGSHNSMNPDGFNSDLSYDEDDYIDIYYDDIMYDDEYEILQAHFDNVDIPPGVEAPIPWLPDPAQNKKKLATATSSPHSNLQTESDGVGLPPGTDPSHTWWSPEPAQIRKKSTSMSSSSLQAQVDAVSLPHGVESSSSWIFPEPAQSKKKPASLTSSTQSSSQTQWGAVNLPPGVELSNSWRLLEPSHSNKKPAASSNSTYYSSHNQVDAMKLPPGVEPSLWGPYIPSSTKKHVGTSSLNYSSFHTQKDTMNLPPPGVDPYIWWQDSSGLKKKPSFGSDPAYSSFTDPFDAVHILPEEEAYIPWVQDPTKSQKNVSVTGSSTIPFESINRREKDGNEDDILQKFQHFKQFDTVQDHSDHRYNSHGSSLKQPPKIWAKKIQEEWKILEKDLPDTIFVRVYESRMDLLRAVIVGAEGTPYHDGLFFFDVFFPCGYPNVPPLVHYHSGGLRLNPNLYECGKVCLSLLNTWSGNQNEKWIPGVSTMLQVLVSIQGLILNAKPFFNEPGFASMSGSASGEKRSQQYNENTFILSLKSMLYNMRKPPKHFEDFVVGHFCKHSHDILVACKAYKDGAQVGCLVKGGVQDVDEGDKSCSEKFKGTVADYVKKLVRAFTQIGAKDCEKFLSPAEKGNKRGGSTPKASNI